MLRYSHFSLFFSIVVIAIVGLVPLNLTSTLTWADGTTDDGHQSDDERADHTHSQGNTITLTDKAKANIGLRTAEVDVRSIETIVHVHGNVMAHPEYQAVATPRISGIVKRIHSSVGEFVEKGDLLLELESLDLQMAQIEMVEAVAEKKSLESKLARLTEVFAKQIRRELQTRQIDYLQSLSELQELQIAIEKRKELAITEVIRALEQMRFRLVKADVELRLLKTTFKRTEALAEKRISAQKELIAQEAEYRKGQNELADAKRQFQILDVSEQTLEKILHGSRETAVISLLDADEVDTKVLLEKYAILSEKGTQLVETEAAYKITAIKVAANKQRALAAGLTEMLLENLAKTKTIVSFNDLSTDALIENYLAFVESSEALEGVLQLEESLRSANITLNKVQQKLQVFGLTLDDIDKVVQTGKPTPIFYVTAPASGQIIEQHVTLGTTVEKSNMLFSILDTDRVWVEGEVHEDALVRLQDKWQIGSEVRIRASAYPETIFTGKISHISSVMNPEERTVHFWTEVNNPKHKLKPGMFTEQVIVLEKGAEVLSVPLNAVLEDKGSWFVFVEFGETYTKQEVVVGAKDDQYIEIREGLFPEEYVVVQGQHQLLRATEDVSEVMGAHGHPH
ncbi:efflux RND transporter periplasmic adaptor subunit [Candidatus Poribacteria bacterium]|nr:efflux RND transporter periplasmic adaptor subunit [Candidatus Poribacteria bacterium]